MKKKLELWKASSKMGSGLLMAKSLAGQGRGLTKRAPDAGDSAPFSSIFLRLIIFPIGRRSAARPSAGNANRWALAS